MSPRVKIFVASVGLAIVLTAVLAVPIASADQCTVTATFLDGTTETFTVNAPPGTPPIEMLPPGTPPVLSVTANCQAKTTTVGDPAAANAGTPVTTTTTTTTHSSSPVHTTTTSGAPSKTTTTTTSSSSPATTTDHKTSTSSSGGTRPTASPSKGSKATKMTTATHVATKKKPQHRAGDRTRRPTHQRDRAQPRPHSERPRYQHVTVSASERPRTATAVDAAFREATIDPAHQPGSSSIPWVLLIAFPVLLATCVGAAKEAGLIRRRI